jgi:hypothetical protein
MSSASRRKARSQTVAPAPVVDVPADSGHVEPSYAERVETVAIAKLKPHPRNYRGHPDDQVAHLVESIKEHGLYRNIIVARDNTILAGHGVVKAASTMGFDDVPVVRLDVDPDEPRALKVLAGDNEIGHLGELDDRKLTEILKDIKDLDPEGLLGTGYDESMLASLVMITRPQSEIENFDEAAAWVGMPDYHQNDVVLKMHVNFRNEEDRLEFGRRLDLTLGDKQTSTWFPAKERADLASVRFEG